MALWSPRNTSSVSLCNARSTLVSPYPHEALCEERGGILFLTGVDQDGDGLIAESEASASATACNGASGDTALTEAEPADALTCPTGGFLFKSGLDTNHDGTLTDTEVTFTQPICNGFDGLNALISSQSEETIESCPDAGPGAFLRSGTDLNQDGLLSEDEVESTVAICDGLPGRDGLDTLVLTSPLPADDPACPPLSQPGLLIQSGLDLNANGNLDEDEVSNQSVVCGGVNGLNTSLTMTRSPEACDGLGGFIIESYVDLNGDGVLDPEELDESETVCDGAPGETALVNLGEPLIEDCPAGGTTIESGLDSNADGILTQEEVQSSRILCNGIDGLNALLNQITVEPNIECPSGGVDIQSGQDLNFDGLLNEEEVTQNTLICVPVPPKQPLIELTELLPSDDPLCPSGGIRVESGLDEDEDGVLSPEEVSQVQKLCNGMDGVSTQIETVTLEPGDPNCPNGGTTLTVWQDLDFDSIRTEEETESVQTICSGIDGIDGLSTFTQLTTLAPDESCPAGGVLIEAGLDEDQDGLLIPEEIISSQVVCNGVDAPYTQWLSEPYAPDETCPEGGIKMVAWQDVNDDAIYDPGLDLSVHESILCHGAPGEAGFDALIRAIEIAPGSPECAAGGIQLDGGRDLNRNGSLKRMRSR